MLPRGLSWDAKTLIRDNQRCLKRLSSIFFDVFWPMTNAPPVPIRGRQQRMNGSDYRGTSVGAPKLDCTDGKCLERTCQHHVGRKRKRVKRYERNQCIVTCTIPATVNALVWGLSLAFSRLLCFLTVSHSFSPNLYNDKMRRLGLLLRLVGAGERIGANLVSKGEELKNVSKTLGWRSWRFYRISMNFMIFYEFLWISMNFLLKSELATSCKAAFSSRAASVWLRQVLHVSVPWQIGPSPKSQRSHVMTPWWHV